MNYEQAYREDIAAWYDLGMMVIFELGLRKHLAELWLSLKTS